MLIIILLLLSAGIACAEPASWDYPSVDLGIDWSKVPIPVQDAPSPLYRELGQYIPAPPLVIDCRLTRQFHCVGWREPSAYSDDLPPCPSGFGRPGVDVFGRPSCKEQ